MRLKLAFVFTLIFAQLSYAATITINTNNNRSAISPYIYGTNQQMEGDENLTCMRLGGNRMTGYNWENNASNAGADWFQSSDDYMCGATEYPVSAAECASPASVIDHFVEYCNSRNYVSILTLPMAGYVAADKNGTVSAAEIAPSARWKQVVFKKGSAFAFPPDTGDGYVYDDEEVWHLVQKYGNASTQTGVKIYQLDNEGDAWDGTHPLIHPAPVGAAEWVNKGISLSKAIKDVDQYAQVFGPAFYGVWTMASVGADWASLKGTYSWYVDYYLKQMKSASDADGRRLLDAIDIHYYSEAREGLYPPFNFSGGQCRITADGCTSTAAALARLQSPRSLWDATYVENSSLGENVLNSWTYGLPLLPKVQASINTYYPGTKIAITEHGFGGGNDYSGGICLADVLGIFGKYGVYFATMWKSGYGLFHSAAYKLYRNYNGSNGTYGDTNVQCDSNDIPNITCYASITGSDDSTVHVIVLNKAATAQTANVSIASAQTYTSGEAWAFGGASSAITLRTAPSISGNVFSYSVPAHSAFHFIIKSGATPTNTPNWTSTPTSTRTASRTSTPNWSATPTLTATATTPVTILNTCDSLTYNGTLAGGTNSTVTINTTVPAAIFEGTGSVKVDITAAAGWNDQIIFCNGITTTDWSGYETLTMDVYVDPANLPWLAGSGWHELQLFVDTSNGKDYRKLTGPVTIQSGMNHLTFILDPALDTDSHATQPNPAPLSAADPIVNYFFALNSDPAAIKTGVFYMDNLVLHSKAATATPTYSRTVTFTPSPSNTKTATSTATMTSTKTQSTTFTSTKTETPDYSPTQTITGTPPTETDTPTFTYTMTATGTMTITETFTASATETPSFSPTATVTATRTWTRTFTKTPTPAYTFTKTKTPNIVPTVTITPTITPTHSVTMPQNDNEVLVYPNPVNPDKSGITIWYNLKATAKTVRFRIFTNSYRLVREEAWAVRPSGLNQGQVSGNYLKELANGTYMYVLTYGETGNESAFKIGVLVVIR